MRTFLTAPAWALALLTGLPVAVVITLLVALSGDSVTFALTLGAVVGLLFGLVIATGAVRQRRTLRPIFDQLPSADFDLARTAARRGPIPTQPAIRAKAVELIDLRLHHLRRVRTLMTVVYGTALAISLITVILGHWWYIPLAVLLASALALHWLAPHRLTQRRDLLAGDSRSL
ncbi:hypothetical protein [Kribbella sp. DT2]|uniref:hypothetical protein n=1 Tax=Kribbella sp. DT2 TaxID=3393427 RepID=UPI003CF7E9AE